MSQQFTRTLAGITCVVAGGGTALLAFLGISSTIFLAAAIAAGSGFYWVATRSREATEPKADAAPLSDATRKRVLRIAMVLFFLLTAGSLLTLRSDQYGKPAAYFVLVAASAGMIALRITLLETAKEVAPTLAMITLVALNFFGSDQLLFPLGIGGADASTHLQFLVNPIVQTGFLPPTDPCGLVYGAFPAHHIFVAMTAILTASDPTRTYYSLGALVMTAPVLVAFLIGRSLFGARIGLLAALILSGSSYFIFWAAHDAPLSFAVPLVGFLLLSFLTMLRGPNVRMIFVAGLFAVALVLTHPYSTIIFGLLLFGLLLGQLAVRHHPTRWPWGTRIVSVSFAYTLLIYWSNFTCLMTKSFQLTQQYWNLLVGEAQVPAGRVYNTLPLSLIFVNTVGDSLLQFLVIVGFFAVLARGPSRRMMMILAPTITLFIVSVVGFIVPLTYLSPNRIYVFLQFIGFAPLAAFAIRELVRFKRLPPKRRTLWQAVVAALLVGGFVFASSASTIAGFETSPFVGNQPYLKLYETPTEVASASWLCNYATGPVTINASRSLFALDRYQVRACLTANGGILDYLPIQPNKRIDTLSLQPGALLWFSRYDKFPGFLAQTVGPSGFGSGVVERLDPKGDAGLAVYNRLYDNGAVQVYLVPG